MALPIWALLLLNSQLIDSVIPPTFGTIMKCSTVLSRLYSLVFTYSGTELDRHTLYQG
jgi:hypothetical protein